MHQSRSNGFRNFNIPRLLTLLLGTVVFFALCGSLIFFILPLGQLLGGDTGVGTLLLVVAALAAIVSCAALLYLLARKSGTERRALEANPVARQFAKQKLLFQASAIGLIVITGVLIYAAPTVIMEHRISSYAVPFGFILGYRLLGRRLWRCPACGYRLSFMRKYRDRQTIQHCPNCNARLQ